MNHKTHRIPILVLSIFSLAVLSLLGGIFAPVYGLKVILIIPGLLVAWRLVRHPLDAFCAYLITVPLSTASEQILGFSITKAAFVILVISWFLNLRWHTLSTDSDIDFWGVVFIAVCVASSLASRSIMTGLMNTARLAGYVLLIIIAKDILSTSASIRRALHFFLFPSLAYVALGVYQFVSHQTIVGLGLHSETGDFVVWKGMVQASSVFDHPNVFATYLLVFLCLSIGLALMSESRGYRLLYLCTSSAAFIGLLVSFSRSGWVGFIASAATLMILYPKFLKATVVLGIVAVFLLLLLPQEHVSGFSKRITPEMDDSMRARIGAYNSAWRMFTDHPILGVGLGSFNERFLEYKMPEARFPKNYIRGSEKGMEAHSTYLQLLAETGALGLLAFICLIFSVSVQLMRLLSMKLTGFNKGLIIGLNASFMGLVVQNTFNSQEYIKAFWVVIALTAGLATSVSGIDKNRSSGSEKMYAQ